MKEYKPLEKIVVEKKDTMSAEEWRLFINGRNESTKNKYHAKPKEVEGIRFASTKEADRYATLKCMQNANEITGLQRQVKFKLVGCNYFLDFMYFDYASKQMIFEDVKGVRTPTYKIKKKQMKEIYNIEIKEV